MHKSYNVSIIYVFDVEYTDNTDYSLFKYTISST